MPHNGNSLTLPEKEMVVCIKHYFDKEKELYLGNEELISVKDSAKRTALATNISEITVWRIMAEFNKNGTLPPHPKRDQLPMRLITTQKHFARISYVHIIFVENISAYDYLLVFLMINTKLK